MKYVDHVNQTFDWDQFRKDIRVTVRAMDNVIDRTIYPLEEQKHEAKRSGAWASASLDWRTLVR